MTPLEKYQPSIAVLAFEDLSQARDQEYFCDGIAEEIINNLVRFSGLRVASRTSSFAFKGKQEDVRSIGQKLGVQAVLEGSVRKTGKQLRITTQLINSADGYHLWSEQYDRKMQDVFVIQEEIAQSITQALQVELHRRPEVDMLLEGADGVLPGTEVETPGPGVGPLLAILVVRRVLEESEGVHGEHLGRGQLDLGVLGDAPGHALDQLQVGRRRLPGELGVGLLEERRLGLLDHGVAGVDHEPFHVAAGGEDHQRGDGGDGTYVSENSVFQHGGGSMSQHSPGRKEFSDPLLEGSPTRFWKEPAADAKTLSVRTSPRSSSAWAHTSHMLC